MLFACVAFMGFVSSCGKESDTNNNEENSNNNSLVGTSWIYYYNSSRDEGSTIRFVSESVAYWSDWEYEHGEYVEDVDQVNYVYNAPNGVFTKSGHSVNFTINGNSLILTMIYDGVSETITYTKQ